MIWRFEPLWGVYRGYIALGGRDSTLLERGMCIRDMRGNKAGTRQFFSRTESCVVALEREGAKKQQ
jgi:hypothetical protein